MLTFQDMPTIIILLSSDDSMNIDGTSSTDKGSVGGKRKAGVAGTIAVGSGNGNK